MPTKPPTQMYFITEKGSETGKKFSVIAEKKKECYLAQKKIAQKYGFKQWRSGFWVVFGKISSCIFSEPPDIKIWKKVKGTNEWMPKKNTKEGKLIQADFNALPGITNEELNACIGYDEKWSHIGYANNKTHFGFIGFDDWDITVPADCEEVTVSRYKQLFGSEKNKD